MAEEHKKHEHKEETKVHHKGKIKKIVIWQGLTVILAILLVISVLTGGTAKKIGAKAAAEKAVNYINTYLLQPGLTAELESVSEKSGLYTLNINIAGREYESYVTADGNLLFPAGAIDLNEEIEIPTETTTPQEIPKTDKPKVELFVMSFCPYGNRAEDTMLPVYNLLKDKVDWNIHYIVNVAGDNVESLHGQTEVDQNEREACVLTEYGLDKWWVFTTYVNKNCGSDGNCWEDAAKEAKLDTKKIESCIDEKGLSLMKTNAEATNSAGASGSPTLIINGVGSSAVYQYGNSEVYKEAICSAFNEVPEECSDVLASSSQTSASAGGSC